MRQIKFRGREIKTGYTVYGGFLQIHTGTTYIVGGYGGGQRQFFKVDPESVAQFVGYDANGNEVYEGDILTDCNGFECAATIYKTHFGKLKLKED